jgi:DNA-binding MarR family transcriptional regulator
MSDIVHALSALARVLHACRVAGVSDPATGRRVTDKQLRTLRELDPADPAMVTELAEYLGVTASTMSLNLGRLEAGGLVRRVRDPEDRRVMNVLLTPEGQRLVERAQALEPARIADVLGALLPEERRRALDGLALLAEAADRVVARGEAYIDAL